MQQEAAEGAGEFFKDRLVPGDAKNPFHPQPTPYGGDGVGEGDILLARPLHRSDAGITAGQLAVQARHHRVQPEQTRCRP